jgi:uncharacterized protein (DUF2237 family)
MQIQSDDINVRGTTLKPCSKKSMVLTGYKLYGYCFYDEGDAESYHIYV